MNRLILLLSLMFSGCATTADTEKLSKRVKLLESRVLFMDYALEHDKCFISYNMCMVEKRENCWNTHENCVTAVYRKYEPLLP